MRRREKPKRRVTKRRRVVSDDEGDLALEVRRTEAEVDMIRQSRTRARPKKRANRGWRDGGNALDSAQPSSSTEEVRPAEETKTSQEEPKELVVSFLDFLHDSVVPLLKYLDGKREKYAISKEVGFYVEMIRNRWQLKRAFAVKREWDSASEMARERATILATECAAVKMTLQE
ncbi:hypothetical protein AXG93_242s1400 [Marchantia polymorpha subsp. ruderalis]|uniref:Uncharacterized protein n=1 Tax=Marchantia polymorpha subsp. ruderalis TaxID=1480154 RepID=A0A176VQ23_MARPO|nr:hypothetical protein AXG93_242s1400 [Marchantia polymorpha subsp. ruderalis]